MISSISRGISAALLVWLTAPAAVADFTILDFSTTTEPINQYVGGAPLVQLSGSAARLTNNLDAQWGLLWHAQKQPIAAGFETHFEFQLTERTAGGSDGLAFVIQNNSAAEALAGAGEHLGYGGGQILNLVAVEIDTFHNPSQGDPAGNHIAVMVASANHDDLGQPDDNSVIIPDPGEDLHEVRITYVPGQLDVFYDNMSEPILSVGIIIDDPSVNGGLTLDGAGEAFVGLTGATGGGTQNHDIHRWRQRAKTVTTVITHGFQLVTGQVPPWAYSMGEAILERAASNVVQCPSPTPTGSVFFYVPEDYTDTGMNNHYTGTWQYHCGSTKPNGPIVLIFDWATESDLNAGGDDGFGESAGDVLYSALRDSRFETPGFQGVDPLAFELHLIGHSRGTVVTSEAAERLTLAGFDIDHLTSLDPHPGDGTLPDETTLPAPFDKINFRDSVPQVWGGNPSTYGNVIFADNYYRADQGGLEHAFDFDGITIPDADQEVETDCQVWDLGKAVQADDSDTVAVTLPDLNVLALDHEHSKIHAWYHGTILLGATNDGAGTDIDPVSDTATWYSRASCVPADDATGYGYALLAKDETRCQSTACVGTNRATPGATGTAAEQYSPNSVYNGDFQIVDQDVLLTVGHAGWHYQGGSMLGPVPWDFDPGLPPHDFFWRVDAGRSPLTHNWMYFDSDAEVLKVGQRVQTPTPAGTFSVWLIDEFGADVVKLGDEVISTPYGWTQKSYAIPAAYRSRKHRFEFRYVGVGGVDVDDVTIVPEPGQLLLLTAGIALLGTIGRRRMRSTV